MAAESRVETWGKVDLLLRKSIPVEKDAVRLAAKNTVEDSLQCLKAFFSQLKQGDDRQVLGEDLYRTLVAILQFTVSLPALPFIVFTFRKRDLMKKRGREAK